MVILIFIFIIFLGTWVSVQPQWLIGFPIWCLYLHNTKILDPKLGGLMCWEFVKGLPVDYFCFVLFLQY
jgi:hypothetical protein